MKMTKQETALISYVRGLCFDDLLDATDGILTKASDADISALKNKESGNTYNYNAFKERSKILEQLAELLGDANADYRVHITPLEKIGTGVTQMINCGADEAIHLFKVIKKYGATCSLEFNAEKTMDPLLAISFASVEVGYFEGDESGDSVILELDSAEFSFDLKNHSFSKFVSDCQITILVMEKEGGYAAWFNSGAIIPVGIEEANNYEELQEKSFAIDIHGNKEGETFNEIAEKLKNGWKISGISDSTGNDGIVYIDLYSPQSAEQQYGL